MEHIDYIIVGGGIAGVSAAEVIRKHDGGSSIAIFSAEEELPYSRVLLPAYVKGKIPRERVFIRRAENFWDKNIAFHKGAAVRSLEVSKNRITLSDGKTFEYGKLLLTTGGRVRPFEPKAQTSSIYYLQTIRDADRLVQDLPKINSAVVVGGSFIALEFLEILRLRSIKTKLALPGDRFFQRLVSEAASQILEKQCENHGISKIYQDQITELDTVFAGMGLLPNVELAGSVGIAVTSQGILTNEFLKTSDEDVYAAGDIAMAPDSISGEHIQIRNWQNAFLQGETAGKNMAGEKIPFAHVPMYGTTNLGFQLAILGNVDSGEHITSYYSESLLRYEEYVVKNGILTGAILINAPEKVRGLRDLILRKAPFWEKALTPTLNFDAASRGIHTQ